MPAKAIPPQRREGNREVRSSEQGSREHSSAFAFNAVASSTQNVAGIHAALPRSVRAEGRVLVPIHGAGPSGARKLHRADASLRESGTRQPMKEIVGNAAGFGTRPPWLVY